MWYQLNIIMLVVWTHHPGLECVNLMNAAFLLPCCQYSPWQGCVLLWHSDCSLSAMWLVQLLASAWAETPLLSNSTPISSRNHLLMRLSLTVFAVLMLCTAQVQSTSLFDCKLKCATRHWSSFALMNQFSQGLFVTIYETGCKEKKNFLMADILLSVNGNVVERIFSIQLLWFVMLFWRLNVVCNQSLF